MQPVLADQLEGTYESACRHAAGLMDAARARAVAYADDGPARVEARLRAAERHLAAVQVEVAQSRERSRSGALELSSQMQKTAGFLRSRAAETS